MKTASTTRRPTTKNRTRARARCSPVNTRRACLETAAKRTDKPTCTYESRRRLESCSRDPIGCVDGMSGYTAYLVPSRLDPSGLFRCKDKCKKGERCSQSVIGFDLQKTALWGEPGSGDTAVYQLAVLEVIQEIGSALDFKCQHLNGDTTGRILVHSTEACAEPTTVSYYRANRFGCSCPRSSQSAKSTWKSRSAAIVADIEATRRSGWGKPQPHGFALFALLISD